MQKKDINVCFICDSGYAIPTIVAITSLKCNRLEASSYKIFVILVKVDPRFEELFLSMTDRNFIVQTINVSNVNFSEYAKNTKSTICVASPSALLKFNLPKLLIGIDKVLYLDGDILINKDLGSMYDTNIDDCLAAVVIDSGSIYYKHEFVKRVENYFNSGVMLLNLKKMRRESITDLLFATKGELKNDNLMDQNVFNIVFDQKIKLLSIKYNLLLSNLLRSEGEYTIDDINGCYLEEFSDLEEIKKEAYIIHYSSKDKPWKSDDNVGSDEWYYYFSKSPVWEKRRLLSGGYKGISPTYSTYFHGNHYEGTELKVSVIIPVYNTCKYLRKSLNSIISQSLRDIEIIVIDDGSNDGSLEVLKKYQEIDERIKLLVLSKNCGQSVARNVGLELAKGKYVYFFDSDDMLENIALETLYNLCESKELDVIYFAGKSIYENKSLEKLYPQYESYYKKKNRYENVMNGQNGYVELVRQYDYNVSPCLQLIRLDYLKKTGIVFYEGIIYEDNIFSFEVLVNAQKILVIQDMFFIRNVRDGSTVTSKKSYRHYEGLLVVVSVLLKYLEDYKGSERRFCYTLSSQLRGYLQQLAKIYKELDVFAQNYIWRLQGRYRLINDMLVVPTVNTNSLKFDNEILEELNDRCNKEIHTLKSKISKGEPSGKKLTKNKEKASWSYYLYLKLMGGIQCYKEHGLKYTLIRVKDKVKNKL